MVFLLGGSDFIDVLLDLLGHGLVVLFKLLSVLFKFGILVLLLFLFRKGQHVLLNLRWSLCWRCLLCNRRFLVNLLIHDLEHWRFIENLLKSSKVGFRSSFSVLVLSHENAFVLLQVERAKRGKLWESLSLMLKVVVSKETCVDVFEQDLSQFVDLLTHDET